MMNRPAEIPSKPLAVPALAEVLAQFSDNILLRDETGVFISYRNALDTAETKAFQATRRRLVMCMVNNDIDGIAGYLALLAANAVPMMVSPTLPPTALEALIAAYRPDYVWLSQQDANRWPTVESQENQSGYALISLGNGPSAPDLHEDLALLLSTSGSTGSGKYVRLSHQNVWSNAKAIADYLTLTVDDLPITTLPPSYSYGLSIIHSHLWVGAGLAVTDKTFFDRDFWNFLREVKATSLAGVPYHYEILKKLRFARMELQHLCTLTQAGGSMSPELTQEYATHCKNKGMRFFTMYGQTEASPRMSYVPAEQAFAKAGTIGQPIPGGAMALQSETGDVLTDAHVVGELVYRGPNVCLGYAEGRADLSLGDVNQGVLYTGDLAERDADGYYRIVGRQKRFIKLFGNRINLQDVEQQLSAIDVDAACSGRDDVLEVYLAAGSAAKALEVKKALMASLRVGAQGLSVYGLEALPRSESGKVRYVDLHPVKARLLA
jgi:acyl-coenzyme A synthetase/AMP-(fatty) acid ligase